MPSTPRRADARRNRERLLTVAGEVFAERGVDAPLDEIARRAGVGNATLYRHFPTRRDLIVAVYADEVTDLCARGEALLEHEPAEDALARWLSEFVAHVSTKRQLASAIPDDPSGRRSALFDDWHGRMHATTTGLLARAQRAGSVRPDVAVPDLLTLANGIAVACTDTAQAGRCLDLVRRGIASGGG